MRMDRPKQWWIDQINNEGDAFVAAGMPTNKGVSDMPDMPAAEAIQMMNRCKHEIMSLRTQLAQAQPKADAYDNIATVLRLLPQRSAGMGEDVIWVLDKRIRELESKPVNETKAAPVGV